MPYLSLEYIEQCAIETFHLHSTSQQNLVSLCYSVVSSGFFSEIYFETGATSEDLFSELQNHCLEMSQKSKKCHFRPQNQLFVGF